MFGMQFDLVGPKSQRGGDPAGGSANGEEPDFGCQKYIAQVRVVASPPSARSSCRMLSPVAMPGTQLATIRNTRPSRA